MPGEAPAPRITVDAQRTAATLHVPAGFDRALLTLDLLEVLLQDAGVALTAEVHKTLRRVLAKLPPEGEPLEATIATATAPVHGQDGQLQWLVDAPDEADLDRSFYERSAYVMVQPGQILGRLIEPEPGEDGRDVTGATIPARAGQPVRLKLDESILQNRRGELIAQIEGVLVRTADAARISQLLEVPGCVDFSTGNIQFDGDVLVREAVRDCFTVEAGGNLEVHGLIEAATLRCGRDLIAVGGMAGRQRGHVQVGGNLIARYLDNVAGTVTGDLQVQREAINCHLTVGGHAHLPHGALIGGELIVTGELHVATLGSPAAVPTTLVLGTVPMLEGTLNRLTTLIEQLEERQRQLQQDQLQLQQRTGRRLTAQDKERQTELSYELPKVAGQLQRARAGQARLQAQIDARRTVHVQVAKALHPGTILRLGPHQLRLQEMLRGPVTLTATSRGELLYQQGSSAPQPLARIATLSAAA